MTVSVAPSVFRVLPSPVGPLTAVAGDGALTGLYFERHRGRDGIPDRQAQPGDDPLLARLEAQLAEYFAGRRREFDLPLAPAGDAFAQDVWCALRAIPYGHTRTYGELARELGRPGAAAQAVGAANGANPISIVVPCHRVVGANGALTGYAGGLDRKRFLLELERPAAEQDGRLF